VTATGKWSMHPSQRRHDPQIASDEPDITRERRSPDHITGGLPVAIDPTIGKSDDAYMLKTLRRSRNADTKK
jgi:hypothetical protein